MEGGVDLRGDDDRRTDGRTVVARDGGLPGAGGPPVDREKKGGFLWASYRSGGCGEEGLSGGSGFGIRNL